MIKTPILIISIFIKLFLMLLLLQIKNYALLYLTVDKGIFIALLILWFSGSTCVSLLIFSRKLFIGNVGDSRAIIIKFNSESA